jgi:hypothetical protein
MGGFKETEKTKKVEENFSAGEKRKKVKSLLDYIIRNQSENYLA